MINDAPRRRRHLFLILLPAIWIPSSLISFEHPGDEYGIYFMSHIVGSWAAMINDDGDIHDLHIRASVVLAGGVVLAGLGVLLDLLRVRVAIWVALWLSIGGALLYAMMSGFDTIDAALQKNGSWTAYVVGASSLGLTFATLLCLFGGATYRALRAARRGL